MFLRSHAAKILIKIGAIHACLIHMSIFLSLFFSSSFLSLSTSHANMVRRKKITKRINHFSLLCSVCPQTMRHPIYMMG